MARRRPLVIGNWKMNGNRQSNERLLAALRSDARLASPVEVVVCPPMIYVDQVGRLLQGGDIALGVQNVAQWADGAYTGETSAAMLKDLAVRWVLIGHSERRTLMGETDAQVAEKAARAREQGLGVVICVGETLEQREAGQTAQVIERQIQAVCPLAASMDDASRFVVAYEPVWAIGTGRTATPEQAQEVHQSIRGWLARAAAPADGIRILYGGSVKAGNAAQLFSMADIDGGLIGGAALVADEFATIVAAAAAR